jgi:hypothetical protein
MTAAQALVKLDIDRGRKRPRLDTLVRKCERAGVRIRALSETRSPGGYGWHVVLQVSPRPRTPMEVVALEAVLGGDSWRSAMQVARARAFPRCPRFMRDAWNVLYQPHPARRRKA